MATWPSGKAEACKAFTPGSNPGVASKHADVAQLVEHDLAKVGVAGSNPVVRSRNSSRLRAAFFMPLLSHEATYTSPDGRRSFAPLRNL